MSSKEIIKEIIQKKKERILAAKQVEPEDALKEKVKTLGSPKPFMESITKPRFISLIAEIKKASPQDGVLRENFDPLEIARAYRNAEVQAVSVLTEEDFFQGSLSYIAEIKQETELPVLRKDFILEPYQVYESRVYGADAVLLIADLLSKDKLSELISLVNELGLDCLVEAHTEKELKKILSIKHPFIIGINNRDLHTLEVDLKTTEKLFPLIPKDRIVVVESGIKNAQDVLFLKILGVNAVLVGTAFMQAGDIGRKIQELMGW